MIKKIVSFLFLVITSSNAQSIMWSNFFDIHSLNSLGGLSQNFVKDSDGNIIVAVVEFDILKLYKIDNEGNIISTLNTNNECGYFSQIITTSENNFALVFDNTPDGLYSTYKLFQFNNIFDSTLQTTLDFSISGYKYFSSFFLVGNTMHFSVLFNNEQRLYYLNQSNQLVLKHLSTIANINHENYSQLQNENLIITYVSGNNHLIRCISSISGQLVWNRSFLNNTNVVQLNYLTTISPNEIIYNARLERTWNSGNSFDVIKLHKIEKDLGEIITTNTLIPINNCTQKIDDLKFNTFNNHCYISYRSCYPNQKIVVVELDQNLNQINQVEFPVQYDNLESEKSSSIIIRNDGTIVLLYTSFKNSTENGNLYIVNLDSSLNINGAIDLNIEPKNSSETFSGYEFINDSKLVILGVLPSTDPLIVFEEVQYYITLIDINNLLNTVTLTPNNKLVVFPNPGTFILNFESVIPIQKASLFDVAGKKITESEVKNNSIDISNLKSGIYLIKVINHNNEYLITKFTKN
ncbi:T9SS type A sorting domain-containing protein [Flavobacterium sp. TBRC 19031]|uniref:T9SS type A sorting domain-containing protein n=1 Tax=Flavobacterium mekongense TaxID=3379707 RepID=UPI00399B2609